MVIDKRYYLEDGDIFEEKGKGHENISFLYSHIITYIGNKRQLINFIRGAVNEIVVHLGKPKLSIFDGFAGSGIVSRFFKKYASSLYVNDLEYYSFILNKCYLANMEEVDISHIEETVAYLNREKNRDDLGKGFIEKNYAPENDEDIKVGERVFYTNKNAKIIDNIRRMLSGIDDSEIHFYLAPLLVGSSIHANTSGVFKGFYKNKNGIGNFGGEKEQCLKRIKKDIVLKVPVFSKFNSDVYILKSDINDAVKSLNNKNIDIAYYDPPYNQHPYGSNYFMLNLIANYVEPQHISKVSGIPSGWNKSVYNNKANALNEFNNLILNTNAKYIVISYNNEGIVPHDDLTHLLKQHGKLQVKVKNYSTFKASRNLHKRNKQVKEFLFILKKS